MLLQRYRLNCSIRSVQTCHKLTEKSSKIVPLGAPSSSISLHWNELEKLAVTAAPLRKKQAGDPRRTPRTCRFVGFLELFVGFCRAFLRQNANCHENVTLIPASVLQKSGYGRDRHILLVRYYRVLTDINH
jgi:hypothetical protein